MSRTLRLSRTRRRTAMDRCSKCGKAHDTVTHVGDGSVLRPKPGDVSVCIACGEPHVFDASGHRIPMPAGHLDDDPDCKAVVRAMQAVIRGSLR